MLHYQTNHPKGMVNSLPWSQLLRVRRIVSEEHIADDRLEQMCSKFKTRGYPTQLLQGYKNKALLLKREDLLHHTKRDETKKKRIPFVSTYGSHSGQVSGIIRNHWKLLQMGCPDTEAFGAPPLMSFKRDRNLRDSLVRADIGPQKIASRQGTFLPTKMGNFPCLHCSCCNNLTKGDTFFHPLSGRKFQIKQRFTCTSSYVIYMITCPCGICYIGETTQEIKCRIIQHKSTIRRALTDLPVPAHFIEKGHTVSQLRYRVIDGIPRSRRGGDRQQALKKRELFWIYSLDTLFPKGMNVDYKTNFL